METENTLPNRPELRAAGRLLILEDETQVFRAAKDLIRIGSLPSADVHLTGEGVAPVHAVIEARGEVFSVHDLAGGTAGIYVNGLKVVSSALKPGDTLQIGERVLRFRVDEVGSLTANSGPEDLRALLLEDHREVIDIFDFSPETQEDALEVVLSWSGSILNVEHFVPGVLAQQSELKPRKRGMVHDSLSSDDYPLLVRSDSGFAVRLGDGVRGVIHRDGKIRPLSEFSGSSLALKRGDYVRVHLGGVDFFLSFTHRPPHLKVSPLTQSDPFAFRISATSLLLTLFLLLIVWRLPKPEVPEPEQLPERMATILFEPKSYTYKPPSQPSVVDPPKSTEVVKLDITPDPKNAKPANEIVIANTAPPDSTATRNQAKGQLGQNEAKEGEGARAKGQEGRRGDRNSRNAGEPQKRATRPSAQAGRGRGGGASRVVGDGNVDLLQGASSKLQNVLGNVGARLGKGGERLEGYGNYSTRGSGGAALSGDGRGGGGNADTLGGLSDKGRGGGRVGTGMGAAGSGTGLIGGKTQIPLRMGGPEELVLTGEIDRGAVEAAILARKDEFKNCYEREINTGNSRIKGNVTTAFVIASSGRVSEAGIGSTSLRNTNVERCVLDVIRRIQFPIPRGAGLVQVTYPFKFNQ